MIYKSEEQAFPADAQIHVLRHFKSVDEGYLHTISVLSGKTVDVIKSIFETPGSKFNENLVSNPNKLLNFIAEYEKNPDSRILKEGNVLMVFFSVSAFPQGIGTDNILALNELTTEENGKIYTVTRDGFKIKCLKRPEKKNTWQINIIFRTGSEKQIIRTIFPGRYSPPFPNLSYQSKQEFERNRIFWENNVFLI